MVNFLLVGNGAREHAIAESICKNSKIRLFAFVSANNPGIVRLCMQTGGKAKVGDIHSPLQVKEFALQNGIELAFPSPDAVLAAGVTDALLDAGISVAAPTKEAARLEWDKAYCRQLLRKHKVDGLPNFEVFETEKEAHSFIDELEGKVAVKPSGLTGGKGVKVSGFHLQSVQEAKEYASQLLKEKHSGLSTIVIEEKLDGEEFSLQAFSDGKKVYGMPMVQDHKRAYEGDIGPNTGGMGSYSGAGLLLPFATKKHYTEALRIMQKTIEAFKKETKQPYIGVLYGGFMITAKGVKLIEYNSRFGDPEAMNVLSVLKSDLLSLFFGMAQGKIKSNPKFAKKATVCKYLVPEGYPIKSTTDQPLSIDMAKISKAGAKMFFASVYEKDGTIFTMSSRSLAFVGIARSIAQAEKIAEEGCSAVSGKVWHRKDIGTPELIQKRKKHLQSIGAL
ncbi:MAG: phosphoribosylamine--glycine ligase [Candidatus Anstonellaceae archaeon]